MLVGMEEGVWVLVCRVGERGGVRYGGMLVISRGRDHRHLFLLLGLVQWGTEKESVVAG